MDKEPTYSDPYTRIAWWQEKCGEERIARVRAEEALRRIEWIWEQFGPIESDGVNRCPACAMTEEQGHDRSCSTARALDAVPEENKPS